MSVVHTDPMLQVETTCGSLLYELQIIWDEVGESDSERDEMLLELERECLEVYRRKVDTANRCRAQLRQKIADAETQLAAICSAMGERPVHIRQSDQAPGSLKAELKTLYPELEEMQKRKVERRNQFFEVVEEIRKIRSEINESDKPTNISNVIDDADLSLRKLEELHTELQALQKEKNDRLKQVVEYLRSLSLLCQVLGMDYEQTSNEVHSSLGDSKETKSISDNTIESLAFAIQRLQEVKIERMQQLQDLATSMLELWNLMDTPIEEKQMFQNVTCNVAASEHEIVEPNILSVEVISYVEAEVFRLEELKASKMKELVFKKRSELEEICMKTHMIPESDSVMEAAIDAIETGVAEPAHILEHIEIQIGKVKEEALGRKEILEKVEKWMAACEEECWLDEYNNDENRYNAGRGAHIILKRAEKARALVSKLPGMVESLAMKTTAWEKERGIEFTYDGIRLIYMLEEYNILRQEKEQERKRQRDQKKLQGQLITEQEAIFGSKPSPMKSQNLKKGARYSCGGVPSNRRLSLGGAMLQTPKPNMLHPIKGTPNTRQNKRNERPHQDNRLNYRRDDEVAALSAGRRGLDIAGLPVKKHSFNASNNDHEVELPITRKPFSPISSSESSKAHADNISEDLNKQHGGMFQKTLTSNITPFTTPTKLTSIAYEENRTPAKTMTVPVPCTPKTVSVSMQTIMTPAPQPFACGATPIKEFHEEIEYSFEERRAGFVLTRLHPHTVLQV
ncbi:65-kDa microtubule-associated protein 3 [Heracleum sosnowskyi]|uniref:65-kDa microtubule-associated protein 3 n=1 Tax=Heracleum sosnowskyi TaxID=360622 RepID=A0AAD8J983_9APIA|nr:65-kDa microtubule-associated protein 3 [Heracleum sosnowskyi]